MAYCYIYINILYYAVCIMLLFTDFLYQRFGRHSAHVYIYGRVTKDRVAVLRGIRLLNLT